ncbi:MAG: hypothetical protein HYU64_05525 [Armatimonadetes bacterium]|nr:hypothetical protein [Armatimonadota bacterium]
MQCVKKYTREQIQELIADLAAPVGPDVFSGFGTEVQNLRFECWNDARADDKLDDLVENRLDAADLDSLIDVLLEIVRKPPGADFLNNFYGRRRFDWDYWVTNLFCRIASRDRALLTKKLAPYEENPDVSRVIEEVKEFMEER